MPDDAPLQSDALRHLARQLVEGRLDENDFLAQVRATGVADVGDAHVDLDRRRRCGFPEVVYSQGKSVAAIERIFTVMLEAGNDVLATRMSAEQAAELSAKFPSGRYNPVARTFRIARSTPQPGPDAVGRVTIVTAGTTDQPVAEEARETVDWTGAESRLLQDVGVAGPHRLPGRLDMLRGADCVIVVAGMEGALPSVVGGYVDVPVVAVPTSVGYGASFGGVAALLGMLNSCSSNVAVVNIDAGFKAGYIAGMIARNAAQARNTNPADAS
jgi:hypothetical protein